MRDDREEARERVPPHNYEAEQALLAAVMTKNDLYFRCDTVVKAEDFADPLHGRIWTAIGEVMRAGSQANFLTLKPRFDSDPALAEIGGAKYLARLENAVVTLINIEDYAIQVRDLAVRRRAINDAEGELAALYSDHDRSAIEIIAERMAQLERRRAETGRQARMKRAVGERVFQIMDSPVATYETGIRALDESLGDGLHAGRLYGFGAYSKVGKTAFAGTISHNLNARRTKHLFICMEVDSEEVEQRNMARVLDVSAIDVMHGRVDRQQAAQYLATIPDCTVYEDAHGAGLADIRGIIMDAIARRGITGFVLDYWQRVTGKSARETEEWHLREVAETMANICRRHGVWGLVPAQLNQQGTTRGGEGLKLCCDWYGTLNRPKDSHNAWVDVELCRYTRTRAVGTEDIPALWMHYNGPWFQDVGDVTTEQMELVA